MLDAETYGNLDLIKKILETNAASQCETEYRNILGPDAYNDAPLFMAAYFGHLDVVIYLMENTTNTNKEPKNYLTLPSIWHQSKASLKLSSISWKM